MMLIVVNTLIWCVPLYLFALLRFIGPNAIAPWCTRRAMNIAEFWIDGNNLIIDLFQQLDLQIELPSDLNDTDWYLIFSNHQSWSDILILQRVFNRRIPMLKFFIKQELIYTPVIGIAWWALDFPIMKRYSRSYLMKHPEKKGNDLKATRKSCEKFRLTPVAILNFLEGTRFTDEKKARQHSPYEHLLLPRGGGAALVVTSLPEQLDCVLDVTIRYKGTPPTFFGFFAGKTDSVDVNVRRVAIPTELTTINYESIPADRKRFQSWLNELWREKDRRLSIPLEH